ncbi:MAG TPA: MMPL family transporter [Candidatus Thermoplasmatota archaeon]
MADARGPPEAVGGASPRGGIKGLLDRLDTVVDSALNRRFDPLKPVSASAETRRFGLQALRRLRGAGQTAGAATRRVRKIEARGRRHVRSIVASRYSTSPVEKVIAHPFMVGAACIFIAVILSLPAVIVFGAPSLGVKSAMRADLEVFLPPDDPATAILAEIRMNYSTELLILLVDLYVPGGNITQVQWMKAVSNVEGDEEALNETGIPSGVNYRLDDVGQIDGVQWVMSLPTVVKIAAVAGSNFLQALSNQTGWPPAGTIPDVPYAIPNDQATIDSIVESMEPEDLRALAVNREGDEGAPLNRMVVLLGLTPDPDQQTRVIDRAAEMAEAFNAENGGVIKMRLTGPVVVFKALQGGVSQELGRALPFIVLGLLGLLYFWHRNWRVWLICLLPVALASGITYGIVGLAHYFNPEGVIIAPQAVLAAPVLLALGVSYGLYISNRFVEETGDSREARLTAAVKRINPAIFLSAATTGIGFFSLMIGTLPPIWTLGLALTIGILLTYGFVYALVPVIITVLGYEKRAAFKDWKRLRDLPQKKAPWVVLVSVLLVGASMAVLASGSVSLDVDYLTMTPAGTPSVEAMREYSATMGGGQLGMVLTRGNFQAVPTLDDLDRLERSVATVEDVKTLSVVTVMKLVKTPATVEFGGQTIDVPEETFWDLLHRAEGLPGVQANLLSLFYGSVPVETRSMLVDTQFSSSLVYIFMPFLPVDATKRAVTAVNEHVDGTPSTELDASHMAGIQTVTVAVNDLIITSQIVSLIVAIALTFIVLWVVFGSLRVALMGVMPVSVVTALEPGVLVLLSVPLSTVTVMIGSIAIGTGVDFSIQMAQRMRLGGYTQESVNGAVERAGVSFVEATTTMCAGFAGMFAMNIVAIQQFVLMIIALLTLNMLMAMFLFPAVASIWIKRRKNTPPPDTLIMKVLKQARGPAGRPAVPVQAGEWAAGRE